MSRTWSGWGCGLVDLDNDGWLDLFVANGGLDSNEPQPNHIFRNQSGRFSDVSADAGADFAIPRLHRGAAFADFDNDGRIDIAVTSINEPIELWMNKGPVRHWLQLTLTGKKSNHSALGVKVICHGTRTQVSSVANSVGYASCSDLRVHFGVGDDRKVAWKSIGPLELCRNWPMFQQINCLMLRNRRLQLPPQPRNLASNLSVKRKNKPDPACRPGSFFVESNTGRGAILVDGLSQWVRTVCLEGEFQHGERSEAAA